MKKTISRIASTLIYTLAVSINLAQAQEPSKEATVKSLGETSNSQFQVTTLLAQARSQKRAGFALMPADKTAAAGGPVSASTLPVPNLPVFGSGSLGRLTKWIGFTSTSSGIGDSNIYEDKFGKVGIGTTSPTSLLTVQGVIETSGGIKFADGTMQTTSPAGALFGVAHDSTLQGNGTTASLLGVGVPFILSGSVASPGAIIKATNTSIAGAAIHGVGGNGSGTVSAIPVGVMGDSDTGLGVVGISNNDSGVYGISSSGDRLRAGVQGICGACNGVKGSSLSGDGVTGEGKNGVSGIGNSGRTGGIGVGGRGGDSGNDSGGEGVFGVGGLGSGPANRGGDGVFGLSGLATSGAASGFAGRFVGNVDVQGTLTKTMGTFKIDHPLDPENKYLYHSFVESPDMMNIYNGSITTDPNGEAIVEMPDYFDALNKDFHYQLTVIGTFAQAIIATKMTNNHFVIRTNAPNVEVSWTVTGVRQDAYAEKHRVQVEELKAEKDRGYYIHPEVFNQPEEKSIEWARHPELMQTLKQQRLDAESRIKKQ